MNIKELKAYGKAMALKFPQHTDSIGELIQLAEAEIHDGESEEHECELAERDIKELCKTHSGKIIFE